MLKSDGIKNVVVLGATGSIVADGVDGLLFKPGDPEDLSAKIAELYDDLPRCRAMGEAGAKKADANYSQRKIYECLKDIFDRAFENNRRSSRK